MNTSFSMAAVAVMLAGVYAVRVPNRAPEPVIDKGSFEFSAWREALAERRALQLDRLHEYALRGVFPLNHDFEDRREPYFIDALGTPCAVANLLIQDVGEDVARQVAFLDNHVRLASVSKGPVLDWILASGLLQEEAAAIQPSYAFLHQNVADNERRREQKRVRAQLLAVEARLREQTQTSLDLATGRLLTRIKQDPGFAPVLKPVLRELTGKTSTPFAR